MVGDENNIDTLPRREYNITRNSRSGTRDRSFHEKYLLS